MLSRDGVSGLVCLAISVILLTQTFGLPPAAIVPIGAAFYPRVVLSILIYALLGKLADSASRALERLTLSWHPAFQKH